MNKSIIFSLLIGAALCVACDPVENRDSIGGAITAEQLDITATPVVIDGKNSNKVILENHSPVLSSWDYGIGTSTRAYEEVLMVITGESKIKFTGLNPDGSKITKDLTVKVDELSFEVAAQYAYLCGTGQKTWVWDTEKCFGNGGDAEVGPAWWTLTPADVAEQCKGKGLPADGAGASMTFTLQGMKMVKTSADGAKTEGTFSFAMKGTSEPKGIGLFTVKNTNILCGYDFNAADVAPWSEYTIVSLDNNTMVLGAKEHAPNTNYWYWVFKAK